MMTKNLRPGIGETSDIRLIEVEEGRVVLEATPDVHLYSPIGRVHGGFAATMLDFARGYAVLFKLRPGMSFSTLELKMAYHKAVTKNTGPVRAEGSIVTMGRQAAFTNARLVDVDGRLYASFTSSLLVMNST